MVRPRLGTRLQQGDYQNKSFFFNDIYLSTNWNFGLFFERVFKEQVKVYCFRERGEGLIRESKNSFVKTVVFQKGSGFKQKVSFHMKKFIKRQNFAAFLAKWQEKIIDILQKIIYILF